MLCLRLNPKFPFARMHSEESCAFRGRVFGRNLMLNFIMYPIVILFALLGAGSSVVIVAYLFIVLAQKIKNKVKYGASLYD